MARLDFDYGGRIVRARDPRYTGRDRDAELEAARVLEGLGALELAHLEDAPRCPATAPIRARRRRRRPRVVRVHRARAAAAARARLAGRRRRRLSVADRRGRRAAVRRRPARPDRPDWFGLELGIEIDGHRVDLLPALLELLDGAGDLAALARTRGGASRCASMPPLAADPTDAAARARQGARRDVPRRPRARAPSARASLLAELCAAIHDGVRPLRWIGDPRCAIGVRDRDGAAPRVPRRAAEQLRAELRRISAKASRGSSTCARTAPAACSPTTWASARRCRRSRTC